MAIEPEGASIPTDSWLDRVGRIDGAQYEFCGGRCQYHIKESLDCPEFAIATLEILLGTDLGRKDSERPL